MIETKNVAFENVDYSNIRVPRAFTDIPFGVFSKNFMNVYEHGYNRDVHVYNDEDFPLRKLLECYDEALMDDGLGFICHSSHQTEDIIENARDVGLGANYGENITLYYQNEHSQSAPPLYTTKSLAQAKYIVTLIQKENHEYNYEYVYNAIPYPREKQDVDWHPCPFHLEPLRYIMESFGGDTWIDFCAGSGSVGKVAKELGKDAILIEKEQSYYEKMKEDVIEYETPNSVMDF